uniref:C2H2-type domain-containing protein n=1 Tax=Amorphochlora amoebiformis TaxID=1561963 RepID=A0A7S0GZN5_9EUKA
MSETMLRRQSDCMVVRTPWWARNEAKRRSSIRQNMQNIPTDWHYRRLLPSPLPNSISNGSRYESQRKRMQPSVEHRRVEANGIRARLIYPGIRGPSQFFQKQCSSEESFQLPKRRRVMKVNGDMTYAPEDRMRAGPTQQKLLQTPGHLVQLHQLNVSSSSSKAKVTASDKNDAALLLSLALASEMLTRKEKEKLDSSSASTYREDAGSSSTETKNSHEDTNDDIKNGNMTTSDSGKSSTTDDLSAQILKKAMNSGSSTKSSTSNLSNSKKPFKCDAEGCGCSFSTRFSLKRHMKKHTGERPHICPYNCGKRFAEKSTLTRHVRIHTGEKPYICKFPGCGKSFADRTNVKRHELIHLGQRPYHCKYCQRGFFRPKQVVKHVAKMHPDKKND